MSKKQDAIPWVDKYRPKRLDDIIQQTEIVKVLKNTITTGDLPHLLLYGPPGTGKTSTILATALELFGPRKMHERVIELNASDDRGISIVRNNIITFAKTCLGKPDPNYPSPNFKIVILDEADAMTTEAQAALRQIIESTSHITRFCFICNYINQIIEPIASRCVKFRFKPIDKDNMAERLEHISKNECMKVDTKTINALAEVAEGDARYGIMLLHYLKYMERVRDKITDADVYYITGNVDDETVEMIWKSIMNDNINTLRDTASIIHRKAFPVQNILDKLRIRILKDKMSDDKKSVIMWELCKSEERLLDGADEYLQILYLLMMIQSTLKTKKKNKN